MVTLLRTPSPVDADTPALRVPPHNTEAEQALLGAILTNNRAYEKISDFLRPEHFADAAHQRIYEAVAKLIERGQLANPITLKSYFEADGLLAEIGGTDYLARLVNAMVTVVNALEYGRIIFDAHLRRQLIDLGEDVVNNAFGGDLDSNGVRQIEEAEARLYELATTGQTEGGFQSLGEAVSTAVQQAEAAYKRASHITGVTTGLIDMDKKLGGLHPSDLVILAGRPSMGKTALATNMAFNAAKAYADSNGIEGGKVAFFSLEMASEQLATRIMAERAEISGDRIRRGDLQDDDFQKVVRAAQEISALPLFIDDTPAISVSALRTRCRRLQRQQGLGMIVIDYLQLLSSGGLSRPENRVQELSEITRGLKALAKELHVPVLALSQLSRQVEQRDDKRPQLADLRESGSIEQDSDVVMFVFREQYYLERAEPKQRADEPEDKYLQRMVHWQERCDKAHNRAEVNIAKQRHGPIGTIELYFEGMFTRFGNLDREDYLNEEHE